MLACASSVAFDATGADAAGAAGLRPAVPGPVGAADGPHIHLVADANDPHRHVGTPVEYYTRLERGNAAGASEDVLEGVARALQLDEAERGHLFDLVRAANATSRPTRRRPAQERVRPTVQRILDSIGAPAYVSNGRLDLIAANTQDQQVVVPERDADVRPEDQIGALGLVLNALVARGGRRSPLPVRAPLPSSC